MLKNNISLIPQEYLGYHMGLTVPPEKRDAFYNPRVSEKPPVASGFGTQIQTDEFSLNKVLQNLSIPLSFSYMPADTIESSNYLKEILYDMEIKNRDSLICLNWGRLTSQPTKDWGHVLVFDRVLKGKNIRLIDTDVGAKWKSFPIEDIYSAINMHGTENMGGLWNFLKT
jgi:hypothetical protein